MLVSSLRNPRIRQIRALRTRKERDRTGLCVVEGIHVVVEAIQQQTDIVLLVVAPSLLTSDFACDLVRAQRRGGTPCFEVSAEVFESITFRGGQHGIAAVVRQRWESLLRIRLVSDQFWIALDSIQYPGNLGTILRTADAVGAAGAILLDHTTDPYDPEAVRASMGAIFSQRLVRTEFAEFVAWARRHGALVVGTASDGATDFRAVSYRFPLILLMGCERTGLSAERRAICDTIVRIPMLGRCDSLNLAVAASLALYEVFRQR